MLDGDLADTLDGARRAVRALAILRRKSSSRPTARRWRAGETLVQRDLAATLEAIAQKGPRGFYEGAVAEKIAAAVRDAGGSDDGGRPERTIASVERAPVRGTYRGYDIVSMPPPSSGGVHLIEMLNILEGYPLAQARARRAPTTLHLMAEAMKRAYADRAVHLGDPDFVQVPVERLISKSYAATLRAGIDPAHATPSKDIRAGDPARREGDNTTHYSVVDRHGNAVSNTYTLNLSYGVGLVAEGTGVLLNNELDDFSAKPGAPNAFGLVGGDANAPAPGKRPLSSMTPTIVLKNGKPFLVTGTPGGSRIITTVLQVIVNAIDLGMSIAEAVSAPRIHHQWMPDELRMENDWPEATMQALKARGHNVVTPLPRGSANSILVTPRGLAGAADPRTRGALAVGY